VEPLVTRPQSVARNVYAGAKITLLILVAVFFAVVSRADDLVTAKGTRYENVRVTEITPTTIAFRHSAGAARLSFTELGPDVQKKYGYDEAKAKAWLAEEAKKAEEAATAEQARKEREAKESQNARRQVEAISHYMDDGGHIAIDPRTGQIYDPEIEAARRSRMLKDLQRYGRPQPTQSPR
jgi:hypothetical protein